MPYFVSLVTNAMAMADVGLIKRGANANCCFQMLFLYNYDITLFSNYEKESGKWNMPIFILYRYSDAQINKTFTHFG